MASLEKFSSLKTSFSAIFEEKTFEAPDVLFLNGDKAKKLFVSCACIAEIARRKRNKGIGYWIMTLFND